MPSGPSEELKTFEHQANEGSGRHLSGSTAIYVLAALKSIPCDTFTKNGTLASHVKYKMILCLKCLKLITKIGVQCCRYKYHA